MIIGWNASDDLVGSVNQSAGVTWKPVEEQSSITLGKQYSKPLEQVPGLLCLLLPGVPCQGSPQPLDLPLCLLLPAPQRLHHQGDKGQASSPAVLTMLGHLVIGKNLAGEI